MEKTHERLQRKIETSVCTLYLVASEKALEGVHWTEQKVPFERPETRSASIRPTRSQSILDQAESEIQDYLAGRLKEFTVPLHSEGTEFQKQVWKELMKIPYGQTCSYRDIAQRIGNTKACRAVGTANGRNPISILVPCHRVIAADGTLGGYAGGLGIKERLLKLEGDLAR